MSLISLDYVDVLDGKNDKKVLEFSSDLLEYPVNEKSLFVIKVDGQSMQPMINDRALVVSDLSVVALKDKAIYLLYYENKMWIKQAKQEPDGMTFVSINKDFSHLVYKASEVRVVAKALLTFTNL